ncbi:MAG: glycerate kinase [Microcystaceae cyanobacterium]
MLNTSLEQKALDIFLAGVQAADPKQAVNRYLTRQGQDLLIGLANGEKRCFNAPNVHLIAFGKAACAMAESAQAILSQPSNLISGLGLVVTNYQNVREIPNCQVFGAQHPTPDEKGYQAAQALANKAQAAQEGELVLVLISGGGSALVPYPPNSISLADKIVTTKLLLGCGANINQINGVRKHLSQLKGGQLTRWANPAQLHALILSDVIGDEVTAIASGTTVPDPTTYGEAIEVLQSVWEQVPVSVRQHLGAGQRGEIAETPKENDPIFEQSDYTIIGSNGLSVHALIEAAKQQDFTPYVYQNGLTGEASQVAQDLVEFALKQPRNTPLAILAGGETTVTLTPDAGKGGRNQEMALAFAIAAKQRNLAGNWVFLSGGTDGRDGPTDVAGGIINPQTLSQISEPEAYLNRHDAYHALEKGNALLEIGATGTNVADLQVLLLLPS